MTCENDFDCPGKTVCYKNETIAPDSIFCACDSWFGYTGDGCDEFGPLTVTWIVFHTLITALAAFIILLYGPLILRAVYGDGSFKRLNAKRQTLLLLSFHVVFRLIASIVFLVNVIDVDGFGREKFPGWDGDFLKKRGSMAVPVVSFQILSLAFAIATNLNVGIVWVETAFMARNLIVKETEKLARYRKIVRGLEIAYLLVLAGMLSLAFTAFPVVITFGGILMLTLYGLARSWFLQVRDTISEGQFSATIAKILRLTKYLIFLQINTVLASVSLIFVTIAYGDSRSFVKPGDFHVASVFTAWLQTTLLLSSLLVARYLLGLVGDSKAQGAILSNATKAASTSMYFSKSSKGVGASVYSIHEDDEMNESI
mmetsp:Transcript_6038/g.7891  ORF Transcript_6038/g.7891 Transcript_6038/m.7891 type:complete len:370 (-) Transcript_6038:30-1139(-)